MREDLEKTREFTNWTIADENPENIAADFGAEDGESAEIQGVQGAAQGGVQGAAQGGVQGAAQGGVQGAAQGGAEPEDEGEWESVEAEPPAAVRHSAVQPATADAVAPAAPNDADGQPAPAAPPASAPTAPSDTHSQAAPAADTTKPAAKAKKQKSKAFKIGMLVLLLVLAIGIGLGAAWVYAPIMRGTVPTVYLAGQEAEPITGFWKSPVLGGIFEKHAKALDTNIETYLKNVGTKTAELQVPTSAACTLTLLKAERDGFEAVFEGDAQGYNDYEYTENGDYQLQLTLETPPADDVSAGEFYYNIVFRMDVQPVIEFSGDRALQGDIITVKVDMGFSDLSPTIKTELGDPVFVPVSERSFLAFVPVNYAQAVGKWDITVDADAKEETGSVIVTSRRYSEQHMIISQETTNATMNNPDGPKNWNERVVPLNYTHDDAKYWTEQFLQPVEGRVSTQFGLFRYTNDNPTPRRHTGIDIAAETGTPVPASNAGRVVLAESVIYTGNTVVIEHGGGLKTYYFHMNELKVNEGDMVDRGQIIGTVGSTGYSTGAHLHFEVKIGECSLSPYELWDGTSEVYFTGDDK